MCIYCDKSLHFCPFRWNYELLYSYAQCKQSAMNRYKMKNDENKLKGPKVQTIGAVNEQNKQWQL